MIRIYGSASSINVRKVLWTCELLYIQYEIQGTAKLGDDRFGQLNPNKMMPVIMDLQQDDFVLWESNTIIRYLAEQYSNNVEFYPSNPQKRAGVNQWMDWQATDFNASWSAAFQKRFRGNDSFTEQQDNNSLQNWKKNIEILEQHLAKGNKYMVGEKITLADVCIGLSVNRWIESKISDLHQYPNVLSYFDRFESLPGFSDYVKNGVP